MLDISSYHSYELSSVPNVSQNLNISSTKTSNRHGFYGYEKRPCHSNRDVLNRMYMVVKEHHSPPQSTNGTLEEDRSYPENTNRSRNLFSSPMTPVDSAMEDSNLKLFLSNHLTIKVRVPEKVVGLVVGPKGATIKRIQKITNTFIITPSKNSDPVFTITGTEKSVSDAKDHIRMHIINRTGSSNEPKIVIESSVNCAGEWNNLYSSNGDNPSYPLQSYPMSLKNERSNHEVHQNLDKIQPSASLFEETSQFIGDLSSSQSVDQSISSLYTSSPAPLIFKNPNLNDFESQVVDRWNVSPIKTRTSSSPPMKYSVIGLKEKIGVEEVLNLLKEKMKMDGTYIEINSQETTNIVKKDKFCIMCFTETNERYQFLSCHHTLCIYCVKTIMAGDSHCPICRKQIVPPKDS